MTRGVFTDLPIPATAEIALEGEMLPPEAETRVEVPFGEWAGYYASGGRPMPVFKVRAILHRNNPILQGNPPSRFPPVWSVGRHIQVCATLWNELDNQIPGVKGVWCIDDAAFRGMTVISLHQTYAGHAKQAALLALGSSANMRLSRYIIIVDEDIDPSNTSEVLWALGTRTDPKYTTEFIDGCWGGPGNPMVPRDKLARGELEYSRAIILACKPYHWMKDFPKAVTSSPELQEKIKRKWAELFPDQV